VTQEQSKEKAVLVVEDNEVEREGMVAILSRQGYRVYTAGDGAHALATLRFGPTVDLVLMDMLLPMVDGWEFFRERSQIPEIASIPVIVITGLGTADPDWARSLGAVTCFRKPVIVPDMLDGIRRILGPREADPDDPPPRLPPR
jgi:CheY-like chemotaxis protein